MNYLGRWQSKITGSIISSFSTNDKDNIYLIRKENFKNFYERI